MKPNNIKSIFNVLNYFYFIFIISIVFDGSGFNLNFKYYHNNKGNICFI